MRRIPAMCLATIATALLAAGPAAPARATQTCSTVTVPAALTEGGPANQTISGELCTPATYAGGVHRVDVLVHGATYDHRYWDWPQDPGTYSYVKKTTDAGRAAFAYDRPGDGASTRPASASLSVAADAYVLHQLVQNLRGQGFSQVTVVGHSMGSMVAIKEVGAYGDADRLVVTGVVHPPALGQGAVITVGSFYPAALDPAFAGQVLDPGYLTTRPGTRAGAFYDTGTADPSVIAYDEAHKDLVSAVELADAGVRLATPAGLNDTNAVHAHTLVVVGREDTSYCGVLLDCSQDSNVRTNELPYYSSAASVSAAAIADTGHDLTLHPSAGDSFDRIDQWIQTH
ncbi:alpha/beta hydrolase [Actinomadura barringtoniae]|uniref:Alpha/beta hydrolase n=1 Tax=Actinomadura barringtoniae TaxID=1427535 RepID=A0A939T5Z6_9ACTN|nr:alpha/beta hydrolase [Actinomadura barringtoniae]MBO2451253.1 alpha/beta hydrolase [Actinomadura barringtoniae]